MLENKEKNDVKMNFVAHAMHEWTSVEITKSRNASLFHRCMLFTDSVLSAGSEWKKYTFSLVQLWSSLLFTLVVSFYFYCAVVPFASHTIFSTCMKICCVYMCKSKELWFHSCSTSQFFSLSLFLRWKHIKFISVNTKSFSSTTSTSALCSFIHSHQAAAANSHG